jgi:hypothetical protein
VIAPSIRIETPTMVGTCQTLGVGFTQTKLRLPMGADIYEGFAVSIVCPPDDDGNPQGYLAMNSIAFERMRESKWIPVFPQVAKRCPKRKIALIQFAARSTQRLVGISSWRTH